MKYELNHDFAKLICWQGFEMCVQIGFRILAKDLLCVMLITNLYL